MAQTQIYKNLYYDDEERVYMFIDKDYTSKIVNQECYLMVFIVELLLKLQAKQIEVVELP